MSKKIIVVATGGTIAMKYDPQCQGLVPACSGEDLALAVPGIEKIAQLDFLQFSNISSATMTPQNMWDLHQKVEELLSHDDIDGVVITHGTDTVEETGYFLNLLHTNPKPIVLTAAMRGAGDISADGPINIFNSVKAAASDKTIGIGALICLNDTLYSPTDVMKTHSANPATFAAPWWGPVGYVDCDRVIIRHKVEGEKRFAPKQLTARVDIIKCMTGSDRSYIDFAVANGCQGIVIEGFGRGNIPPAMIPGIEDAVKNGVAVVITSRTLAGRVLDVYGYPGSVTDSRRVGAVMGGELTAAKARLKLMIVLSEKPELAKNQIQLEALFDL